MVAAAVAWNLVSLRAELLAVSYLDDSSVHAQMVRSATRLLRDGHLPLTSWFPFLGLGSPQFLHYQSLPSMLAGTLGLAIGPGPAFRWTLYVLLSFWPVSVYIGARLFGAGRPAAAAAGAMSPFLVSATGIGFEQNAYVWTGFGVWTQLWASLTLPLAWGFSWRAIRDGRHYFAAVALVSLTIALHFETGYLALVPLLLWPFVAGAPLLKRVRRAVILLAASLLASAWVIVPLVEERAWAATNELLQRTPLVNGYGARTVIGWLATGQLLDHGRLPVVTVFAAVGLGVACARYRTDPSARALIVALAACLLLSLGRATFGHLADLLPGSSDIFFRRFMMGIQLAALLLAGSGAAWCGRTIWNLLEPAAQALTRRGVDSTRSQGSAGSQARAHSGHRVGSRGAARLKAATALAATVAVLAPAWRQLGSYDRHNAAAIGWQRSADAGEGRDLDRLIELIHRDGGGRVYAGTASNWGVDFTVGAVPVFKYLESRDVDEVGYSLRTASLMTGPEAEFDEVDPSDYQLFAIRYLILPSGWSPPIPARLVAQARLYWLWRTAVSGYLRIGQIVGRLSENRMDVGTRSIPLLRSGLAQAGGYLRIDFGRRLLAPPPLPAGPRGPAAGSVLSEADALEQGVVSAVVRMRRPGVVVLSASFDPGWTATIDGRAEGTEMVAPALVATPVPAGMHRIVFRYRGFRHYPLLFAISGLLFIASLP